KAYVGKHSCRPKAFGPLANETYGPPRLSTVFGRRLQIQAGVRSLVWMLLLANVPDNALGGGWGQQDAISEVSIGQPQPRIFELSNLRLVRVGPGAKSDPSFRFARLTEPREQCFGAPGDVTHRLAIDRAVKSDRFHGSAGYDESICSLQDVGIALAKDGGTS